MSDVNNLLLYCKNIFHTDDVQRSVRRGTQARNVAGVWWNLWFDKRDGKHAPSIGLYKEKKRRASLEDLVASFVRPLRPQMFVCAGGRYVL